MLIVRQIAAIFAIADSTPPGILTPMVSVYDVVWPKSAQGTRRRRSADRLPSLDGARIGFVWDYMFRGEELFPVLERELRARFDGLEVVGYDTFGNIHGPREHALVEALPGTLDEHSIDAVVVGNGC
jgi:hypothetical protein